MSEGCSGGGNGVGVFSSGGAFRVGPAGPMAPVTTMWFVGSFMSNCGKNSVTGLKGSLSKSGNLWISEEDLSSVMGLCGVMDSLSWYDAGGPGCNRTENDFIYCTFIYPGKILEMSCYKTWTSFIYDFKNTRCGWKLQKQVRESFFFDILIPKVVMNELYFGSTASLLLTTKIPLVTTGKCFWGDKVMLLRPWILTSWWH